MSFERPTIEELRDRARADIKSRLTDARPELRRSLLGILADLHAGGMHGVYGYLAFLAERTVPDRDEAILEDWASFFGVDRIEGQTATGEVTFTGENDATIPAETVIEADDGTQYTTDEQATIAAGEATVAVTAVEVGAEGNQDAGTELSLLQSLSGVDSPATVAAGGITGGADRESLESLADRLRQRLREAPHGGADSDYVRWARQAHADVTRVWVAKHELGLGTVTVRLMTDDATADGIPEAGVIDEVQAYIGEYGEDGGVRPVTADVQVVAPIPVALDIEISINPDTPEVRERMEAAFEDFLRREARPGGTIRREALSGELFIAAGDSEHTLIAPAADVTHDTGEIAVVGTITWT